MSLSLQGRYQVEGELGRGGIGVVLRAVDTSLANKPVAIKQLSFQEMAGGDRAASLFLREGQILSRLSHPNVVRVTDCFHEAGRLYLVMDLISGKTLESLMPCGVDQVLAWTDQILDALTYLHSQSPPVIVRDLKPANLMVEEGGRVRLIDFGLARRGGGSTNTTAMGTPGYAPIEQYGEQPLDARADLYALGATMYALLTGQEPPAAIARDRQPLAPPRNLNPRSRRPSTR